MSTYALIATVCFCYLIGYLHRCWEEGVCWTGPIVLPIVAFVALVISCTALITIRIFA